MPFVTPKTWFFPDSLFIFMLELSGIKVALFSVRFVTDKIVQSVLLEKFSKIAN